MRTKIIFLDLEATVIDEFRLGTRARTVNIEPVRRFLAAEAPAEVRPFSFALSDARDVTEFGKLIAPWLGDLLGVRFNLQDAFTTRRLFELCRRHGTVFENEEECMLLHSKDMGFLRFLAMSPQFDDTEVVLVDDAVPPMVADFPRRNLRVRMVDPADLT